MKRLAIVMILSVSVAFLASGCLWGFVRDASYGVGGRQGAEVRWRDSKGNWNRTNTNSQGYYVFDPKGMAGEIPFPGEVWFEVWDWGCHSILEWRVVLYDDNLQAKEASESQERQDFDLRCTVPDDPDDPPARFNVPPEPPPTFTPTPTATSTPIALPWPFTPVPPPR